jgi:hypothetical protein
MHWGYTEYAVTRGYNWIRANTPRICPPLQRSAPEAEIFETVEYKPIHDVTGTEFWVPCTRHIHTNAQFFLTLNAAFAIRKRPIKLAKKLRQVSPKSGRLDG